MVEEQVEELAFIEDGFHSASEEVFKLRRENESLRMENEKVKACKLPQVVDQPVVKSL
jgi:hypothetical protein